MACQNLYSQLTDIKLSENENLSCIDCRNPQITHVCLSHGIFICQSCADLHSSLGPEISKVRSALDQLSDFDLKFLVSGGNKAFSEFLNYYNLTQYPIQQKYHTKAVYFYRDMLKHIVFEQEIPNDMPNQIEGCSILTPKPIIYPEFRPIDQPLLQTEPSEPVNCFRSLLKCFFETSNNIGKQVGDKLKKVSEKPSVKKAEKKTVEFFEKVGKTVEEFSEHDKVKKAKETVGNVFNVVKNEFNVVFNKDQSLMDESSSTMSLDATGSQDLDN